MNNEELYKDVAHNMGITYVKKNAAYGDSFSQSIDRFGYVAALVRMNDKLQRLEQLLINNAAEDDESALDTAMDLGNYAIMTATHLLKRKSQSKPATNR
jgi:hypothetical protein